MWFNHKQIEEFNGMYEEIYDRLYAEGENIPGYSGYVAGGQRILRKSPAFLGQLNHYRGEIFTSDRECAALYLTARRFNKEHNVNVMHETGDKESWER